MTDKKTKILTSSRSRSYGKKSSHHQFTRRKQRAIESARVREVKPVENVAPTVSKRRRSSIHREDPGIYGVRAYFSGGLGCGFLFIVFFFFMAGTLKIQGGVMIFLMFLIPGLFFTVCAIYSLIKYFDNL